MMNLPPNLTENILAQINDGVYFVDPQRRITYWNHASERITGYLAGQVVGHFCMANILMHVNEVGERLCLGACPLAQTLQDGQTRAQQVYLHHRDGHRVPVTVQAIPIIENGIVTGAVEIFTENISLAMALARIEELQKAAMLDALTGIGNRRMIETRLEQSMEEWEQHHLSFGVLMVDVDHFKRVNDTYGHDTGDQVLKMVAQSLSNGLRAYDFLGRWGGEEFLVVLANVDQAEVALVSERLRMLVEQSILFLDADKSAVERGVQATISLGGTLIRPGDHLKDLLARADQALYRSKVLGRNRVVIE